MSGEQGVPGPGAAKRPRPAQADERDNDDESPSVLGEEDPGSAADTPDTPLQPAPGPRRKP
jgi:hypothetical protein